MKLKEKLKDGVNKVATWVEENKDIVIVVAPLAIGGLCKITTNIYKIAKIKNERNWRDGYMYDRRLGYYLKLRRKLRSKEIAEINFRTANGERLSTILLDMGVLS